MPIKYNHILVSFNNDNSKLCYFNEIDIIFEEGSLYFFPIFS